MADTTSEAWLRQQLQTLKPRALMRSPQRPVLDADGKRLNLGDLILYPGRRTLKRATVVGLRERSPWDARQFRLEILVRRPDGGVSILRHSAMTLVLDNHNRTQEGRS